MNNRDMKVDGEMSLERTVKGRGGIEKKRLEGESSEEIGSGGKEKRRHNKIREEKRAKDMREEWNGMESERWIKTLQNR